MRNGVMKGVSSVAREVAGFFVISNIRILLCHSGMARQHQTRNLEIPDRRFASSGMTAH
jgi:hypothetical protein